MYLDKVVIVNAPTFQIQQKWIEIEFRYIIFFHCTFKMDSKYVQSTLKVR